jgi:hypothetical protein
MNEAKPKPKFANNDHRGAPISSGQASSEPPRGDLFPITASALLHLLELEPVREREVTKSTGY